MPRHTLLKILVQQKLLIIEKTGNSNKYKSITGLLKTENITKRFPGVTALENVNLQIDAAKVTAIIGENGAGKSTTMKMLTGYLKPTSGTVEICGKSVSTAQLEVKRLIGYLPENTPLYNEMYIKEFLNFVGQTYDIKQVGLTPEQHKKIGMLSKGYKQRVGLAQAIIHHPEVLILDEPTSGLDPNQLADIRALIKELGAAKTVIISTHIMQEVEAICDDVIIINKGKLVANASLITLKEEHGLKTLEEIFKKLTTN